MLRVVRDNTRSEWDEQPSRWPPRQEDDYDGEDFTDALGRHHPAPVRRRKRRSVFGRLALTLVVASLLAATGGGAWFAAKSGALDSIFAAREPSPATASAGQPAVRTAALSEPQPAPLPVSAGPTAARPAVPDVLGLVVLIRNTIVALHQANVTGNYSVLHALGAPGLQQSSTPESIARSFADLRGRGIDLDRVTIVNPHLRSQPVVDDQGFMRLTGFFPVGVREVDFDMIFQQVAGNWRLFGIGVSPGTGGAPLADPAPLAAQAANTIPDAATLVILIRDAVMALNQANLTGNYAVLRDSAAQGFRDANSIDQLTAAFAKLRARDLDLAPVAVIDAQLFRPPAIDPQGFLRLTGFFPSRPEQVNFDLAYQFGNGRWQLFGIGLNTTRDSAAVAQAGPGPGAGPAAGAAAPTGQPDPAAKTATASMVPPAPRLRPQEAAPATAD